MVALFNCLIWYILLLLMLSDRYIISFLKIYSSIGAYTYMHFILFNDLSVIISVFLNGINLFYLFYLFNKMNKMNKLSVIHIMSKSAQLCKNQTSASRTCVPISVSNQSNRLIARNKRRRPWTSGTQKVIVILPQCSVSILGIIYPQSIWLMHALTSEDLQVVNKKLLRNSI